MNLVYVGLFAVLALFLLYIFFSMSKESFANQTYYLDSCSSDWKNCVNKRQNKSGKSDVEFAKWKRCKKIEASCAKKENCHLDQSRCE